MSTVLMLSLAGSPGVTTAALAMTMSWPTSSMLIEADTSRYSSILPGYLRGQVAHTRSIGELAVASNNSGSLDINAVWAQTISLAEQTDDGPQRLLVPGFKDPATARAMDPVWGQLGAAAASFEGMGTDVIFDAGRWNVRDTRSALLALADIVVIVARPTLADVLAVHRRLPGLREELAANGRTATMTMLLVDSAHGPRRATDDIRRTLGLDQVGRLPWDEKTAAVFSDGTSAPKRFQKTPYGRALDMTVWWLRNRLQEQRDRLDQNRPTESENRR